MRRLSIPALAAALLVAGLTPASALSQDAQTIVDRLKATIPDLKPVCSDRDKLTAAVTSATIALATAKKINGDHAVARKAGTEAGYYLYFHCPPS
ncbi:MAG: hypothetical protein J0I45_22015 [Bosea sp.]|nr:hypothetical protein [Bosea sp. (in: a-proteobacteria)]